MRAIGVSLRLVPEAAARERLVATIAEIARRLGTPPFVPHVTLIGSLSQPPSEIVAGAERLAAGSEPLQLIAASVGWRPDYFRCLFLEIAPAAALTDLHLRACVTFGPLSEAQFFPHLSLAYGDVPEPAKQALASALDVHRSESYCLDELQVVRTEGEVGDWRPLAAFALSRRE